MLEARYRKLRELLRDCGSCVVAYSGGVDSVFLAYVAHDVLEERALAVIADTPSLPRRELVEALELGGRYGFPVRVIQTQEFANPEYRANPVNRCYFCKHELFQELLPGRTSCCVTALCLYAALKIFLTNLTVCFKYRH